MSDDLRARCESASRGDEAALRGLLEQYLPDLHAYVRLRAGGMLLARESSADLVQSVCREALSELDGFRFQGEGQFRSWLYTVAQRKLATRYSYHFAQKRDVGLEVPLARGGGASSAEIDLADSYAALVSPSKQLAAKEYLEQVEGAFSKLPEHYREVILLSRSLGLSYEEIAERLGRSTGSVRMLLSRAIAELARHLDSEPGD